jgi:hypothetical protein
MGNPGAVQAVAVQPVDIQAVAWTSGREPYQPPL